MVALNVVIGQGTTLGWTSPAVFVLIAVFAGAAVIFFRVELSRSNSFVDLTLFKNKTFAGATLSNFLLNGAAGTLIVALALVQQAAGLSSLQSGLLTAGYLVAILSTIRVGEKLLQKMGARKPTLYGCIITAAGILLTSCTFLLARQYLIVASLASHSSVLVSAFTPRPRPTPPCPMSRRIKEVRLPASTKWLLR